ncbi:LysR substrate-binding domain-containing protein [Pseudoteredinibacter isoporae]|uniref:DNA-binding transcriptional LysR family regulator n=1 Tax=Pseudoteredinibacter isoporae TaxID=570281 RepID=A0A7X0JSA0_9GAMM|nr:DNA-binding transcriptional LysR family regulator [Pseudoteredinibacter isoporae]NHO86285.1 LysR family transcriptional regulator [Pseudoteredinibacter isoporae]NIB25264.1 LysR family transcriptional regulator [Pseudoteredinibacter isoporae]
MKWEGITEFVQVAETESFTQASQKLGISTAQVSRQVSALEKRLNVKLLYRTTRKVSLTQEGNTFYQHCRALLDGLDAAENAVSQLRELPRGKIKLTAPATYGERILAPVLNNFLIQYPDIEINAYFTNRQIDLVEEGYDIAIRLGKLEDSALIAKRLGDRSNYLCASPSYLERHGTPHSLSELKQHNCLLGTLDYWRFKQKDSDKNIRLKGRLRYNSGEALLDAALKGIGIVQLPDYYVQMHLASGKLRALLEQYQDRSEGVWGVYPPNRYLSPRIRMLIDYLAEHLARQKSQ